jgi:DNA integrity scanning protein DisA with diadenylate cyclase activity
LFFYLAISGFIIYFALQSTFMIKFNTTYFVLTCWLFFVELLIGRYLHDAFVRPYGGDFLVVILIYCFVKTWIDTPVVKTTIGVLLFAYVVEISQYFHLVNLLGWQSSYAARLLMGTSFSFIDLLTYTLGVLFIIVAEKLLNHEQSIAA